MDQLTAEDALKGSSHSRNGAPFSQRFTGKISEDGNTIAGRWELADDAGNFTTDFELIYRRVQSG